MFMKIKNYFNDWNLFEKLYLSICNKRILSKIIMKYLQNVYN